MRYEVRAFTENVPLDATEEEVLNGTVLCIETNNAITALLVQETLIQEDSICSVILVNAKNPKLHRKYSHRLARLAVELGYL